MSGVRSHMPQEAHFDVVQYYAILILQVITLFNYTFIFLKQFYFVVCGLKFIGYGNLDNNLDSFCIITLWHICSRREL
jgi:hypothetical protein